MNPHNSDDILVKQESETDPRFGCSPEDRSIDEHLRMGFVILDKPAGPTSHQVVSWVKGILGIGKAGHSGTLDPKVSGVLPIGLLDSTKLLRILLSSGKEYITFMRLHSDVPEDRIRETLQHLQGVLYQTPPLKSAVKIQLRKREIYELEIFEVNGRDVLFRVDCEAGTYIRKLCHDAGLILGSGASMKELRRIRSGPFTEDDSVTLHDLKDAFEFYKESGDERYMRSVVYPMEDGVSHLKKLWVNDNAIDAICHGAPVYAPGISKLASGIDVDDLVAVLSLKSELVALGRSLYSSQDIMAMDKGKVLALERVIMREGTYPKKWGNK
ncbi:MAG: RNA-guided pseudouridylation complex pseudouridine synthase subunit Cbf5 [Candidatus Altiarchaeales archaeon ex4484_2]|nr:MAG: RNA-guided pseudouridylation complex pseudouridine synthase subunit Cbf5 [Candidatus Altiarchaeales archaeon ex4484_2]